MSTAELKVNLIKSISSIENADLLRYIQSIINIESDEPLHFSSEQKQLILDAQEQFKQGDFLEEAAAEKDIEKWLK